MAERGDSPPGKWSKGEDWTGPRRLRSCATSSPLRWRRCATTGRATGVGTAPLAELGTYPLHSIVDMFTFDIATHLCDGRLAEQWVQTDYRSFLAKLGVTTTESAPQETHTHTVRDPISH